MSLNLISLSNLTHFDLYIFLELFSWSFFSLIKSLRTSIDFLEKLNVMLLINLAIDGINLIEIIANTAIKFRIFSSVKLK